MSGMPITREDDMDRREGGPRSLAERWAALPLRWKRLLLAVAAVLLFVLYRDWVWPVAEKWNAESDRIEAVLDRAEGNRSQLPSSLAATVESLGPIRIPSTEGEGSIALAETVNAAIRSHPVTNFSFDARAGARLPPAALREIASGAGERVERVVGEIGFTATAEQAAEIIGELEASPDLESISRLRISRSQTMDRRVDVKMTVEAWVLGSRGRRTRR
jgi:type II secretory pathway component PulM